MNMKKLSQQEQTQINKRLEELENDINSLDESIKEWKELDKFLWSREEFGKNFIPLKEEEEQKELRQWSKKLADHEFQKDDYVGTSSHGAWEDWLVQRDKILSEVAEKLKKNKELEKQRAENRTLIDEKIAQLGKEMQTLEAEKVSLTKRLQNDGH